MPTEKIKKIKMLGFYMDGKLVAIPVGIPEPATMADIDEAISEAAEEIKHSLAAIETDYVPPQEVGTVAITHDQVAGVLPTDKGKTILFGTSKAGLIMSVSNHYFSVRLIPNS